MKKKHGYKICLFLTPFCLSTVFKDHDINDTGALNGDYLLKALLSLQLPVENSDIPDLFECVGREKDGIVDLEEFTDIVLELKVK